MTTLSDQSVAVISAGASGIGLAIARALHDLGYALFVLDVDATRVGLFCETFGSATATVCDVSDPAQVAAAFEIFRAQHQRVDLLVNNAGIAGPQGAVEDLDVTEWQHTIDTDLNSLFYMTRHVIPIMKSQRTGAIINMSSNAGLAGCPHCAHIGSPADLLAGDRADMHTCMGKRAISRTTCCMPPLPHSHSVRPAPQSSKVPTRDTAHAHACSSSATWILCKEPEAAL